MGIAQPFNPVRGFGSEEQRKGRRKRSWSEADVDDMPAAEFNKRRERRRPKENNTVFETLRQLLGAAEEGQQPTQQPTQRTQQRASQKGRQYPRAPLRTMLDPSNLQAPTGPQQHKRQQGAQPNVAMFAVPASEVRQHPGYITLERQLQSVTWPQGVPPPQPADSCPCTCVAGGTGGACAAGQRCLAGTSPRMPHSKQCGCLCGLSRA